MRIYLFVVGVLLTTLFSSCCSDCEGTIVRLKWIYINETPYQITHVNGNSLYNVAPFDTSIIDDERENVTGTISCGLFKEPPGTCFDSPCVISYSGEKCDTLLISEGNQGIRDINRYECKKVSDKRFELTYRYTQSDYDIAKPCQ